MSTRATLEKEYGNIFWWGFSPAFNLSLNNDDCNSVLIIGASDGRHLFFPTFSETKYFIIDSNIRLYARQILLLYTLHDEEYSPETAEDRLQYFLSIYGNSKIRKEHANVLTKQCNALRNMIMSCREVSESHRFYSRLKIGKDVVDLSGLKFREIDSLEQIFKHWAEELTKPRSCMNTFWDVRNRHLMERRYECADGVIEMDYEMRLKERISGVSLREYSLWRKTGLAFHFEQNEEEYEMRDNVTLISMHIAKTKTLEKKAIRGFWGDIVAASPYLAFGVDTNKDSAVSLEDIRFRRLSEERSKKSLMDIFENRSLEHKTSHEIVFLSPSISEEHKFKGFVHKLPPVSVAFIGNSFSHLLIPLIQMTQRIFLETPLGLITVDNESQCRFKDKIKVLCAEQTEKNVEFPDYDVLKSFVIEIKSL